MPSVVFADFEAPTYWQQLFGTDYILPSPATLEIGDSGNRVAKIYVTDLDVSGVFTFGGTMGSDLDMDGNDIVNIDQITGDSTLIRVGAGATSKGLNAEDDLLISGKFEVNDWLFANGRVVIDKTGAGTYLYGQINGDDYWKMGGTPDDGTFIAVNSINGQGNNNVVFMDSANTGDDYGHSPASSNPTMFIHSSTAAAVATDEWISFSFDPTIPGAVIGTGSGTVRIDSTLSFEPSSDTAQANDSTITCSSGIMRVVGDGGATVLDTDPAIADGETDGQTCVVEGTSDANTVTIADGNNIEFDGSFDFVMGQGDSLWIHWDEGDSTWYEFSRSDN